MAFDMTTRRETGTARVGPRTQAQRRAATRSALLEATVECLVVYGYAGTTTGRIADLAGVSRGAQAPYFPTRADLLSAAIAHFADKRARRIRERFAGREVTLEEAVDALWEEHAGETFGAALELWVACRTDGELRETLHRVEREVMTTIANEARSALGSRAERPGFDDDLLFVLATFRGLALMRVSNGGTSPGFDRLWMETRARLLKLLG